MALIANTNQPYVQGAILHVAAPLSGRFPTPPTAWGFTELVASWDFVMETIQPPLVVGAALQPEGSHMEPTKGQIWPR